MLEKISIANKCFIQQECIKLIKSDNKDLYTVRKDFTNKICY